MRTRGAVGLRLVGLREARRELQAALRDGTSVGIVGDRDLTGGGMPTELFGAPAQLPLGPAMLARRERRARLRGRARGGPAWVATSGRLDPVDVPAEGSRRERVTATMAAIARGFERIIEDAPEQWWAVFFPIWPDLEAAAAAAAAGTAPAGTVPEAAEAIAAKPDAP